MVLSKRELEVPLRLFPPDFAMAQARFRASLQTLRRFYPTAELARYPLPYAPDLAIEWLTAVPPQPQQLIILTTGLHGVEGYVGAAIIQLFLRYFLPQLNHQTTGLLLVQPLNPWGMARRRRVNGRNVDLNRNFFLPNAANAYDPAINPTYRRLDGLLNPQRPLRSHRQAQLAFFLEVARVLPAVGVAGVRAGTLLGQYWQPRGIYYGGQEMQPEARWLTQMLRDQFARYGRVFLIDVHTGYGPRFQMSLVHSPRMTETAVGLARTLTYPLIVSAVPGEFYAISGDMVDFAYQLAASEFPDCQLYALAFEFGTLGDSFMAGLRSLQALIWENQLYWHGAANMETAVYRQFNALFDPSSDLWREKALADAQHALQEIVAL